MDFTLVFFGALFFVLVFIQIKGFLDREDFESKVNNRTVTENDIKKYGFHYEYNGWGNKNYLVRAKEIINQRKYTDLKIKTDSESVKNKEETFDPRKLKKINDKIVSYNSKLKEEAEILKKKSPDLYAPHIGLNKEIKHLENSITICKKCKGNKSRIWDLNEKVLTLKCTYCNSTSKYYNLDFEGSKVNLKRIVDLIDIIENKLTRRPHNPYYPIIKVNKDYTGVKKSSSIYYPYILVPKLDNDSKHKINISSRKISEEVKKEVWNRDGGKCVECGSNEFLEFDHIIPFSKGGSNTFRNIQLLCESCNRKKSNKIG